MDDIESKLDTLIDLYMQDRKRFLSLPILPDQQHSNNPNLPPLPPNPPSGGGSSIGAGSGLMSAMSSHPGGIMTAASSAASMSSAGPGSGGSLKVIYKNNPFGHK